MSLENFARYQVGGLVGQGPSMDHREASLAMGRHRSFGMKEWKTRKICLRVFSCTNILWGMETGEGLGKGTWERDCVNFMDGNDGKGKAIALERWMA